LDKETDVVAGVKAGRRALDCRRGVVLFSSSAALRHGEEWVDCEVSPYAADVLRRATLSFTGELGREDDITMELEPLDAPLEPGVRVPCLPLPVCGTLMGLVADLEMPVIAAPLPLRKVALEGDLRLPVGDDWWPFGTFSGGKSKLRMFSTTEGIGIAWTLLTAGQSARGILSTSSVHGGRQQPGQPGLLYPVFVGGGIWLAHWTGMSDGPKFERKTDLAKPAALEAFDCDDRVCGGQRQLGYGRCGDVPSAFLR
jgi:hypothetical protein